MSISAIIITIANSVISISVSDLFICLLTFLIFYISKKAIFSKFNIHPSLKRNKIFWVTNELITLILLIGIFIVSTDVTTNHMGVHYGFTLQFI